MEPTNKNVKRLKVRGTGCYDLSDNSFEFVPFNEAPSTKVDVKTCAGGGKRWTTTGSDPSRMISLKCKASSPDLYAELAKQFNALTKDLKPKQPLQMPERLRVVSEDGLECWLDEERGEVTYTASFDLTKHCRDWQAEVLRQVQLVVRRLPANERFVKAVKTIKKGGDEK